PWNADTTTTTGSRRAAPKTISATRRTAAGVDRDDPPNLRTLTLTIHSVDASRVRGGDADEGTEAVSGRSARAGDRHCSPRQRPDRRIRQGRARRHGAQRAGAGAHPDLRRVLGRQDDVRQQLRAAGAWLPLLSA